MSSERGIVEPSELQHLRLAHPDFLIVRRPDAPESYVSAHSRYAGTEYHGQVSLNSPSPLPAAVALWIATIRDEGKTRQTNSALVYFDPREARALAARLLAVADLAESS